MSEKYVQVCPKCGEPFSPDKTISNVFGIFPYGFKCKRCKYQGAGPIKIKGSDLEEFIKEMRE